MPDTPPAEAVEIAAKAANAEAEAQSKTYRAWFARGPMSWSGENGKMVEIPLSVSYHGLLDLAALQAAALRSLTAAGWALTPPEPRGATDRTASLLPCPFCRGEARVGHSEDKGWGGSTWIECAECGARGPAQFSGSDRWRSGPAARTDNHYLAAAVMAWNKGRT